MPTEIIMPALSPTMEEGKVSKWLVKAGSKVSPGDIIAEIETDKATMDVEAIDDGTIERLLVAEGDTNIPVNTPIALISIDGDADTTTSPTPAGNEQAKASPDDAATTAPSAPPANAETDETSSTAKVSATSVSNPAGNFAPLLETDLSGVAVQNITMRDALRDAMAQEMRRDPDVFLMGEEVAQYQGAYKISEGLLDEFGDRRVIDTPITEQGFAGVGIGASFAGLKPIVEFMTWNFAMQAIDQIINSAAKTRYMSGGQMQASIVFRGPNGAASRVAAQHSQCYSAWYAHCPGLKVIAPSTPADAKGLLKSAIRDPNPIVFLENELLYGIQGPVPDVDDWLVPIGKARIARPGEDVTIVSFARGMTYALEAADILAKDGIAAEVIDLRTLRPLDIDTVLSSVAKTHRLVTVEEAWPVCSVGSEICAQVAIQAFDDLDAPPRKVSGVDVPMPYAANLEKLALPTADQVVKAAKAVLYL